MWLEAIPYCPKFRIQSCEYRAALRLRMFLPMSKFAAGSTYICSKSRGPPVLDPYGHHLTTGCSCGGYRHRLHDDIKYEVNGLIRYAGY